jgi:hypothetical protein
MEENKAGNERALELRAHVARWIQAHPPDAEQARADCASLTLLGAEAALASGASEEDFVTLARDMYRNISSAWQRQS